MSRMLLRCLRRWMAAHGQARRVGGTASDHIDAWRDARMSRRAFLQGIGAVSVGLAVPGCTKAVQPETRRPVRRDPGQPRVVIVGAGIAGMACCHRLARRGVAADVYEATARPGGRIVSPRGLFPGVDVPVELGGTFIDSHHTSLHALSRELGLDLIDVREDDEVVRHFVVDGVRYAEREIIERLEPIVHAVEAARAAMVDEGENITYEFDAGARELDHTPLLRFIEDTSSDKVLTILLEAIYLGEYGIPLDEQSALNLVMELDTESKSRIYPIYGADEVFRVAQGNEEIPRRLAERHADQIRYGHALEAMRARDAGGFVLTFADTLSGSARDVVADVVVLALPFTILRRLDIDVDLPPVQRRAIDELGYGTNAKLFVHFDRPFWRDEGLAGEGFLDRSRQTVWENTRQKPSRTAVLTSYRGGRYGLDLGHGTVGHQKQRFLDEYSTLHPNARAHVLGEAVRQHWPTIPTIMGSYSGYEVGQWTSLAGAESLSTGWLYFCGEHTSYEFQGYMNGASSTGERAADDIAARLDGRASSPVPKRACRRRWV